MREQKNEGKKKRSLSALLEKNYFVMALSVLLAFVFWCIVSMSQTNEVEKTFQNISVRLSTEDSAPANKNLRIYGGTEYYVDVTVKGKSYVLNEASFADRIVVTPSFSSVSAAGSFNLPLSAVIEGYSESDAVITSMSKTSVSVYFDEEVEKKYDLTVELLQGEGYAMKEGFSAGTPTISEKTCTLVGPALEMNKIAEVKAVATLTGEISESQVLQATVVPVGVSEGVDFANVRQKDESLIYYITLPVSFSADYTPTVSFANAPDGAGESVAYTVSPEIVNLSVSTGDAQLIASKEINIGTIDFAELDNDVNRFRFPTESLPYTFTDELETITVTVDMSEMGKRWMEVPVNAAEAKLPAGATLVSESVKSVQIVCPADMVSKLESSDAYAVPVLDGVKLKKGDNTVPVKIVIPSVKDAWAYGSYTAEIRVD